MKIDKKIKILELNLFSNLFRILFRN